MNNFQREGSISNSHVVREFENKIQQYFHEKGMNLDFDISVPIGIKIKKNKKFDLGSINLGVLIECKAHTWTKPNYNSPSAKLTTWVSEMYKFQLKPEGYKKIFVVQYDYSPKHKETLLQYFIRLNKHLIPDDVEMMEYDIGNGKMYERGFVE